VAAGWSPGRTMTVDPGSSARESLLDAGAALVQERRTGEVLPGVREVCQRAGRSTAVFYGHFENLAGFHDDLIDQLLSSDVAFEVMGKTMNLLAEVTQRIRTCSPDEIPRLIASVAAANMQGQLDIGLPAFRARLLFIATADDRARRQALMAMRRLYEHVTDVQILGYKELLDAWGREPRPPYDLKTIAITITAVADGLVSRRLFEPDLDVVTLFEDAVRSLIPTLSRRIGVPDDLDEALRRSYRPLAPEDEPLDPTIADQELPAEEPPEQDPAEEHPDPEL
jgi:AcrR family transcriptional regulator